MSLLQDMEALGADTEDALRRFMNNSALYEKMLKKFPAAAAEQNVTACLEKGGTEAAATAAHTLKGITGNLSLTPLYEAYTGIVASLRAGDADGAKAALDEILPIQEQFIACIEKNM